MDEFNQGIESARSRFDAFSTDLSKAGESITKVGTTLTKGVTLPIAGLGAAIMKTGMDYESGMSRVQAISGATGEEMAALGEKAMEMAAKTRFSTSDSAEAYQYMAMAGWDASQMIDGLAGIMNLAAASGENLGTTSDIVTDALTAFGLTAADSSRFSDVLAAASNSANTSVSMLGESFQYAAPVAGAMGYSVEDVSIALGLMANSGIKASQAGTTLRTAITNMASPTSNMVKVMDEYGISLTDADGNMLSLAEIMDILRERMGGLDESTQAAAASALFGKEAMSGMLAIINAAPEDFDKLTEAINNSAGTTEEMAAIMQDNAAGAFEKLKSAVDVLFTKLSESLLPAFTKIVEKATEVVNWFGNLDESTQNLILTIAGIAAAAGPVLVAAGNMISAVGNISSGLGKLIGIVVKAGSSFSGLFTILAANPIAAVIAAVAGLTAGIVILWNTNEDFRNAVGAIWEAIKGFFVGAWEAVQKAWGGAKEFFGGVWSNIKETAGGAAESVKEALKNAWDGVQSTWSTAKEFFGGIWADVKEKGASAAGTVRDAFRDGWEGVKTAWDAAKGFFGEVWQRIKDVFGNAWETFKDIGGNIVQGIKDGIFGAWDGLTSWVGEKFGNLVDGVKSLLGIHSPSKAFAEIGGFMMQGLKEGVDDESGAVDVRLAAMVKSMIEAFSGLGNQYSQIGMNALNAMAAAFSGAPAMFASIGENAVAGLSNGLESTIANLQNKVTGLMNNIAGAAKKALGIHSPSRVFAGIGKNMALGLSEGWDGEYSDIKHSIESGLSFAPVSVGLSASGVSCGRQEHQNQTARGVGDTYVTINSPVAVDAVQAAREWTKTAQRMALGYV